MFGELIIIVVGFLRWMLKGCKTDISNEINGYRNGTYNIRSANYIIGIIILIIICSCF